MVNLTTESCFPTLIAFFGPDGAGKSTQARMLVNYLRSHGRLRVRLVWIRGRHTLAFVIANFLIKLGYYRSFAVSDGTQFKVFDPQSLPRIKGLWGFIEFVSVLPWILLKVYLPRFLGFTVVAERYVIDTVAYLGYWLGEDFLQSFWARSLISFIPRNSKLIFLDGDTQDLLKRIRNDYVRRDFLVFQRRVYHCFAKVLGATVVNTSESNVEEAFRSIIASLSTEKDAVSIARLPSEME